MKNIQRWSNMEHNIFLSEFIQYGNNWKLFTKLHQYRTCTQIRTHAQKFFIKYNIKHKFTQNDCIILQSLIELGNGQTQ